MKTAISIPDTEFERYERIAARHGMNRSQFYRRAADRFASELEGASDLTRIADAVIARAGDPSAGAESALFVREAERIVRDESAW